MAQLLNAFAREGSRLLCIGIVGKQNEPLFFYTDEKEVAEELHFQFIVHSALDVIEEARGALGAGAGAGAGDDGGPGEDKKDDGSLSGAGGAGGAGGGAGGGGGDMYIGLLCPVEEYRVYGYITTTRVKFMAVVTDTDTVSDRRMREFFERVHDAFVEAMLNPFHRITQELTSTAFTTRIVALCDAANQQLAADATSR